MYSKYLLQFGVENLKVEKLQEDVKLPSYAEELSNGLDLYIPEDITFKPGVRTLVNMKIKIHFPPFIWGMLAPKSGLAVKKGLDVMAGIIDESYRGIIHALMINHGNEDVTILKGEKLLQMILMSSVRSTVVEGRVDADTQRGEGGFGSTGK